MRDAQQGRVKPTTPSHRLVRVGERAPAGTRLTRSLTTWYLKNARDLPWRKTRDPYRIWISEVMLQQTTVATVIPYYKKWLRKFPTLKKLASAPLDDVLKAWEGLGYYARARNLHKAAQAVVEKFHGRLPSDPEALLSLPGFGPYITAAVSSIAFQKPLAVVDGNVYRVVSRLDAISKRIDDPKVQEKFRARAQELLHSSSAPPGTFNQAMMELGALICRPRDPRCGLCPVSRFCAAYQNGDPTAYPVKKKAKTLPHYDVPVAIIRKGAKFFIQKRKPEGFLGGLWEFPGGKRRPGESIEACLIREIREELDVNIAVVKKLTRVEHAYSMFRVTLHPIECTLPARQIPRLNSAVGKRWINAAESKSFAFPAATHRIISQIET